MKHALLALTLLSSLGCASKPLELVTLDESASTGARTLQIRAAEEDLLGPKVRVHPQVKSCKLVRDESGATWLRWVGLGKEHRFELELTDEEELLLRPQSEARFGKVPAGSTLCLLPPGLHLEKRKDDPDAVLLANPELFVGLLLVNSAPALTHPKGIEVRIAKVLAGSPAAKAGLQVEDRLLAIELPAEAAENAGLGRLLETPSRYKATFFLCLLPPKTPLVYHVERQGKRLALKVQPRARRVDEFVSADSISDAERFVRKR